MLLDWVEADKLSTRVPVWDDIDLYAPPTAVTNPLLDNGLIPLGAHVRR